MNGTEVDFGLLNGAPDLQYVITPCPPHWEAVPCICRPLDSRRTFEHQIMMEIFNIKRCSILRQRRVGAHLNVARESQGNPLAVLGMGQIIGQFRLGTVWVLRPGLRPLLFARVFVGLFRRIGECGNGQKLKGKSLKITDGADPNRPTWRFARRSVEPL